jgi:hypothetical protein
MRYAGGKGWGASQMIIRKAETIAMIILLIGGSAFATTYYVDRSAGSDSYNGIAQRFTSGSTGPWQHIPGSLSSIPSSESSPAFVAARGWVKLKAGDRIIVKGGTVSLDSIQIDSNWYDSGSSGNTIKITSGDLSGWGSGRAVIDGEANTNGVGNWSMGFHIFGPSYIHIEGFEIRNMANIVNSSGIFIDGNNASHEEIVGNLIHEIYGAPGPSGYGIEVTGGLQAANNLIEKNVIYHTEEKAIELYTNGSSIIRYNYLYQTNDHAVVISSSNNTLYGNIIAQAGYHWMTYETPFRPAFGLKVDGGSRVSANSNVMYNNLVINCSSGIGILVGNNNTIVYNTVYHSGFQGGESGGFESSAFVLAANGSQGTAVPSGNKISDNIFYYGNILNSDDAATVAISTLVGSNNTISNNVIYRDASHTSSLIYYRDNTSSPSHWYDVTWLESSSGFAANGSGNIASKNIVVDPLFSGGVEATIMSVLPTGFDSSWHPTTNAFALTSSSPAAVTQGGDSLGEPFNVDVLGRTRTLFSRGAYESTGERVVQAPVVLQETLR